MLLMGGECRTASADRLFEVSLKVRLFLLAIIIEALDHNDFASPFIDASRLWHLIVMILLTEKVVAWLLIGDGIFAVFGKYADHTERISLLLMTVNRGANSCSLGHHTSRDRRRLLRLIHGHSAHAQARAHDSTEVAHAARMLRSPK